MASKGAEPRRGSRVAAAKGRRMTVAEKYAALKRQTEQAGMTVTEVDGRLVVTRKGRSDRKR